ncbi:hypothetical protein [Pseudomonas aeruginosa]|uniref:hypothetical protein n=1 Tax=Pseudomonas aeruginosa TaxID=287 RepID=UPI001010D620|nr:hypothetical protein [Pseudomonas aeruginosa]
MGDNQVLNVVMSSASLVISLALLLIHLKNRKTQLRAYFLSRETYRSSIVVLDYVASEQLDENVLLKLVLFSPGSVATVIRSLTLYRKCESRFFLLRAFGITEWRKVREVTWWPVSDPNCKEQKYLADEYRSLYVDSHRDIYVLFPGFIDRNEYKFEVKTNHGSCSTKSTIDATKIYFSHAFRQWFHEK